MRITFPGHLDSDIAHLLAKTLGLRLISPEKSIDPSTGLPSDDRTIQLIIEKAVKNISAPGKRSGFLLNNYPQNVIQAQSLDMAFARANQPLDASIFIETTKMSQNRVKRALIRYYRSQNKLILIEESSSIEDICSKIYSIHNKRRKNSG